MTHRRIGKEIGAVAHGGDDKLTPPGELQPQGDGQRFTQTARQRFLIITVRLSQAGELRHCCQFRDDLP